MTKLSININKFALIRNSRGANNPDLIAIAKQLLDLGADGITVHPRPDERHVRFDDLKPLKEIVSQYNHAEFNIEGYPSAAFVDLVRDVQPDQVTLVPDPPGALTSSFGWDMDQHFALLKEVVAKLQAKSIRVSLFVDAVLSDRQKQRLLELTPDRVELYTYDYAHRFANDPEAAVKDYRALAEWLNNNNLGINAGHDLNTDNLAFFLKQVPNVLEVSIGHAFVCDCLQAGVEQTLKEYLALTEAKA